MFIQCFCYTTILYWSWSIADRYLMIISQTEQRKFWVYCPKLQHHSWRMESWQRPCTHTFQGTPEYGNKQVHKRLQECKQQTFEKRVSTDTAEIMERILLESEFCLLTIGGAPIEVIKKYIENQGQKDRKRKWAMWQTKHINSEYIQMTSKKCCLPRLLAVSDWCITIGLTER